MWANIKAWFQHPYNSNGSALNWVLFFGLIIVAAGLWQMILLHLKGEIR